MFIRRPPDCPMRVRRTRDMPRYRDFKKYGLLAFIILFSLVALINIINRANQLKTIRLRKGYENTAWITQTTQPFVRFHHSMLM